MATDKVKQGKNGGSNGSEGPRMVKYFRHWRSKKLIIAEEYGYKCFPIGGKK